MIDYDCAGSNAADSGDVCIARVDQPEQNSYLCRSIRTEQLRVWTNHMMTVQAVMQKIVERYVLRRTRVDDSNDVGGDDKKKKNAEVIKALTTIER